MIKKIALSLLMLHSLFGFGQKEWKYLKTKNNIELYQISFKKDNIKQFRLKTTFKKTTLSAIFAAFKDLASYSDWQKDLIDIYNVKKISDLENYDYYCFKFPWPFKDRDAIYHQIISYNAKEKTLNLVFSLKPNSIPEKDGIIRMQVAEGEWKFVKLSNGDIEVNYKNYSDPVGIPAEAVNLLFSDALLRTMANLKEHVTKAKFVNSKYAFIVE